MPITKAVTNIEQIASLSRERTKLREALAIADKALEHYGDKFNWSSDYLGQVVRVYVGDKDEERAMNGYEFAQKAQSEIQNILKQ